MKITMEQFVNFLKAQGFVYQGSELYGGLANTWDYGPLGVELLNNLKDAWWHRFVRGNHLNVGLDSGLILNPETWIASGHLASFSDPLTDCKACGSRFRVDKLIEDASGGAVNADGWSDAELMAYLTEHELKCPLCGKRDFTPIRKFNLMFKTFQGVIEDNQHAVYLRPETAQGIFINFKNIQRSTRRNLPFGVGQIGKSFRNEITPGNFIFRTREFEQAELEFFCKPGTDLEWFAYWKEFCWQFLRDLGLKEENLRFRDHTPEELSFYSRATTDIEYRYVFGWGELWGIADRTDYDLGVHQKHSKENLEYFDPETGERYLPYVVEPSLGINRLFLAVLDGAYDEEVLADGDSRIVLRLARRLAPVKVAVLPLVNKLKAPAWELFEQISKEFAAQYDASGKIGKRYRRQDMIGTPFCVTVDFQTLEDAAVTVRERDSMAQERVKIADLGQYLRQKIAE